MARRLPVQPPTTPPRSPAPDLRERLLADFTVLRIPLSAAQLDTALAQAAQDGCSHLEFLHRLITDQAGLRRQRSTARRILISGPLSRSLEARNDTRRSSNRPGCW